MSRRPQVYVGGVWKVRRVGGGGALGVEWRGFI